MPGSESSVERTLPPLLVRKWQEYKAFVNSGKACHKKCYLELVKGRSSWWGLGGWLAAKCCYFQETIVSPHTVLVFPSERSKMWSKHRRKLQNVKSVCRESPAPPLGALTSFAPHYLPQCTVCCPCKKQKVLIV